MKSNSSILIVKEFEKVNSSFLPSSIHDISKAKAASIHSCLSMWGGISFFFREDTI